MHAHTNKPPAPSVSLPKPARGDEREDSTSTERQPLSQFNRHSDLSFAAKQRVRRSYPTYTYTPSALPRVRRTYCRPRVRLRAVLHSPLPSHSAGLRPALRSTVHTRPEGVK
jgi:hypothetical protein